MADNRKPKGSVILRVAIFGFAVYMIVTLCGLWSNLLEKQNELKAAEEKKDKLNAEIVGLVELLEGSESKIIEKAARERLGYVYAEEQVYIDNSGN